MALPISGSPVAAASIAPETYEEIRNHVTCYPQGLDKIMIGDKAGGLAIWEDCFAHDFQFRVSLPSQAVECPGEACPFPKEMSSVSQRAAFAGRAYEIYKFQRAAHHLTNITITPSGDDRAEVKAYVQTWHQRKDGFSLIGSATWHATVTKRSNKWLIVREDFNLILNGLLVPSGPPPAE
jgi:3-phenylpropionate/cinnamic acid dioxygenase small subunit